MMNQLFGIVILVKSPVNQVHAQCSQSALLQQYIVFFELNMQNNLAICSVGFLLKTNTDPAVSFKLFGKINSSDRIGITKIHPIGVLVLMQTFFHQIYFVLKHFPQAVFCYITPVGFHSINSVAKLFIISRHRFGNGTRSSSGSKKMTCSFLTSTNFGKRSVDVFVQINS